MSLGMGVGMSLPITGSITRASVLFILHLMAACLQAVLLLFTFAIDSSNSCMVPLCLHIWCLFPPKRAHQWIVSQCSLVPIPHISFKQLSYGFLHFCLVSSPLPPRLVRSLPPPAMTSPGLGGAGHYGQQEGPQSGLDGWIEQQQRQFRDFDSSFGVSSGFADFDTFPRISSIFAPSPRQALAPPLPTSSLVPASVNRSMALQSGESDMSPKAKVSYDQDKFQVEFNVQDYTPEVSDAPILFLDNLL